MCSLLRLPLVPLFLTAGCKSVADYGAICAESVASGEQYTLYVTADSMDCSSDHKGVSYHCEVSQSGSTVVVSTTYVPGRDPNDRCAPSFVTSCGLDISPGSYTLSFGGEEIPLEVPSEAVACLPVGTDDADSGRR